MHELARGQSATGVAGSAAIEPGFRAAELVVAEATLARALPYLQAAHTAVLRAHLPDDGELEGQLRTLVLAARKRHETVARYGKAAT